MKTRLSIMVIGILVLALRPSATAQQHAPTAEVCRADIALWYSSETAIEYNKAQTALIADGTPNRTAISKLSLHEINARLTEIDNCRTVAGYQDSNYEQAGSFYGSAAMDRYLRFVQRHHFLDQMFYEDTQGVR